MASFKMVVPLLVLAACCGAVSGFLLDDQNQATDLASVARTVKSLVNMNSKLETTVQQLQTDLRDETTKREKLEREVEAKNDLTYFLQSDIRAFNQSLLRERSEKAVLEARLDQLNFTMRVVNATNFDLRRDLYALQRNSSSAKSSISDLQLRVQALEVGLQKWTSNFTMNVKTLQQGVARILSNLTSLSTKSDDPVYFTYRNADATIPTNAMSPLFFHGEISNVGSAFSPSSGIFTAPRSGVYLFVLTMAVNTKSYVNCYIVLNGSSYLTEVFTSVYYGYSSASSSAAVHVDAGDKVMVSDCRGQGTISGYKTSFTGILISADHK